MRSTCLRPVLLLAAFAACRTPQGALLKDDGAPAQGGDNEAVPGTAFMKREQMTLERMRGIAKDLCSGGKTYVPPKVFPIPALDPPTSGGDAALGMTYNEEWMVPGETVIQDPPLLPDDPEAFRALVDRINAASGEERARLEAEKRTMELAMAQRRERDPQTYKKTSVILKARAALNNHKMDLFIDKDGSGTYVHQTWDGLRMGDKYREASRPRGTYDPNNPKWIMPPIDPDAIDPTTGKKTIPEEGRVLVEQLITFMTPKDDNPDLLMQHIPQAFNMRSNAYLRFQGTDGEMAGGASFRLAAHRLWSLKAPLTEQTEFKDDDMAQPNTPGAEDFPVLRSLFTTIKARHQANAIALLEGELYCGALSINLNAHPKEPNVEVDGYFYFRKPYKWKEDPNTGFAAYSSMFWKRQAQDDSYDGNAAHDSDAFRVTYSDGTFEKIDLKLPRPPHTLRVRHFGENKKVTGWQLANEDRKCWNYRFFDKSLGGSNYPYRVGHKVEVLETNKKSGAALFEHFTADEYLDNINGVSTFREDIGDAESGDFAHFKYRTTSFFIPVQYPDEATRRTDPGCRDCCIPPKRWDDRRTH